MSARTPEDCDRLFAEHVNAGDLEALLDNDWSFTAKGADGGSTERAGRALEVVRRQADGTWRFAIDDPYGRG